MLFSNKVGILKYNGSSCLPADFDWLRKMVWSGFVIPWCTRSGFILVFRRL